MKLLKWIFFIFCTNVSANDSMLSSLKLPPNFNISVYASDIKNPRQMTLGPNNIIFVGSLTAGNVYAVIPDKNNSTGTKVVTIASNIVDPNGVAYHQGNLYVAANSEILKFPNIEKTMLRSPQPEIISKELPNKLIHGWRYIGIGPDEKMYIGVGAPCNNCLSTDPRFASIMRMDLKTFKLQIFAKGVRNTVGFDWNPKDSKLWFTDNGRDWMGDNTPPDELNIASAEDLHFGFPFCHGKNIPDPKLGKHIDCKNFIAPVLELPAHVAALGMIFYKGTMFPPEFQNQIFIAEHGSWNRSKKVGYKIIHVPLNNNQPTHALPFITGWLDGDKVVGRPVALLEMPDGSILISDDEADVIYRVTYHKKA